MSEKVGERVVRGHVHFAQSVLSVQVCLTVALHSEDEVDVVGLTG